jgi:predicted transcriptional regulator
MGSKHVDRTALNEIKVAAKEGMTNKEIAELTGHCSHTIRRYIGKDVDRRRRAMKAEFVGAPANVTTSLKFETGDLVNNKTNQLLRDEVARLKKQVDSLLIVIQKLTA